MTNPCDLGAGKGSIEKQSCCAGRVGGGCGIGVDGPRPADWLGGMQTFPASSAVHVVQADLDRPEHQADVLAMVDHAIENGRLPAAPAEGACTWCDFAPVCGPSAQLVPRHKEIGALAELTLLRRMK